jgi:hypothetical protein
MINLGYLVSICIKCYIRYWRYFASKKHGLTIELIAIKLLDDENMIKNSYDTHRLIIWIRLFHNKLFKNQYYKNFIY